MLLKYMQVLTIRQPAKSSLQKDSVQLPKYWARQS